MHVNYTLPTNWPVRSKFGDWKMGKRNHLVFCKKEDPKEQQYSRSYLIWAMCQIWMSCCSYWAPSATAPEIEKIKHHLPKSNKLLLDANVALVMSLLPFSLFEWLIGLWKLERCGCTRENINKYARYQDEKKWLFWTWSWGNLANLIWAFLSLTPSIVDFNRKFLLSDNLKKS